MCVIDNMDFFNFINVIYQHNVLQCKTGDLNNDYVLILNMRAVWSFGKKVTKTDQIIYLHIFVLLHYLADGIQTVIENLNFK